MQIWAVAKERSDKRWQPVTGEEFAPVTFSLQGPAWFGSAHLAQQERANKGCSVRKEEQGR